MSAPLKIDLGPTLGVGYIGVGISSIIYGVACLQTFQYYVSPRAKVDGGLLHALVGSLWILGSARQALMMYTFYYYLILHNFDLIQTLVTNAWGLAASIVLTAFITFAADCFLIMRIWHLSARNVVICIACGVLALGHFVLAMLFSSLELAQVGESVVKLEARFEPFGVGSAAVGAATDALVMTALSYYLLRSRSGARRTDDLVATLVIYTVMTGALVACFSIASLVSYLVTPHAFYNYVFSVIGAELYINVILTSLNSRENIRRGLDNNTSAAHNTIHLSDIAFHGPITSASQDLSSTAIGSSLADADRFYSPKPDV